MNEIIIDPPVGPYSSIEELEVWLDELHEMPASDDMRHAIEQAESWLNAARSR